MSLLEITDLRARYGEFQALSGVSLSMEEGGVLAVVGANGAGKTTLLKTIAGIVPVAGGSVVFDGHDLAPLAAHQRTRLGIAVTPEGRRLFPNMTVEENLLVGGHTRRPGVWGLERLYDTFGVVGDIRARLGRHLSGGQQQAVAICRALMSNPKLLMLDEVSLGLAPVVVDQIYATLPTITEQGTTVLLVEQDAGHALAASDHVVCLLEGRTVLSGPSDQVSRADLASAYFGLAPSH
ncbi:ABC transporter ATP-binding protein [Nocardioides sp. GY 10127]|uniref:ABC transporter ATP-binding protein n=1 Tax=Nocardioides sp. GY 10127 TaxID=2569762 RepID=UPI0010A900F3|nr:ABC transporter ATP-binding protein [Nocardioides sp. GY 10127]TIC81771.1 ABC transporter ATP-binding protein [Nocardioides sp. GY 10127]